MHCSYRGPDVGSKNPHWKLIISCTWTPGIPNPILHSEETSIEMCTFHVHTHTCIPNLKETEGKYLGKNKKDIREKFEEKKRCKNNCKISIDI